MNNYAHYINGGHYSRLNDSNYDYVFNSINMVERSINLKYTHILRYEPTTHSDTPFNGTEGLPSSGGSLGNDMLLNQCHADDHNVTFPTPGFGKKCFIGEPQSKWNANNLYSRLPH